MLNTITAGLLLIAACYAYRHPENAVTGISSTPPPLLPVQNATRPRSTPTRQTTTTPTPTQCPSDAATPLARLRSAMRPQPIENIPKRIYDVRTSFDGFIIFFSDEHLSDEPSAEDRRLEYISGWDGPGVAAVLADGPAAIWVPSGEFRRAQTMLSTCYWLVLDADDISQPTVSQWLVESLQKTRHYNQQFPGRIGADGRLTSYDEWQMIASELQPSGLHLIHEAYLVDQLWDQESDMKRRRPEVSRIVASLHNLQVSNYTGPTWSDKVALVRSELKNLGAEAMVVTALDEVAWLFNIRGRDMPTAPLLKAYGFIGAKDIKIYSRPGKFNMPVREARRMCFDSHKALNCLKVINATSIFNDLRMASESKILIPSRGTFQRGASSAIADSVTQSKRLFQPSPIIYLKAQKNMAERILMNRAHLKDAVAMCTLLTYLERRVKTNEELNEILVAMKVDETRATQAGFIMNSMKTRVAYGSNAAEPNYKATIKSNKTVLSKSTLIIESGGQYEEGTTVVTRTLHYGVPTSAERRAYTAVLRSQYSLSSLLAPSTLPAAHADVAARAPLWKLRQDYPHPTGHGVGAALNRVEDPVVIDYRQDANLHTFREGYFVTCEPGWYETRKFGIKLGNVLEVIGKPNGFLGFRESTLVPYEPKLIDRSLLTEYEVNWLNSYNERIRKIVGPELKEQGIMDVYYWLMNKTQPMQLNNHKTAAQNSASLLDVKEIICIVTLLILANVAVM